MRYNRGPSAKQMREITQRLRALNARESRGCGCRQGQHTWCNACIKDTEYLLSL